MKLWQLQARDGQKPWQFPWDCAHGFIVRACSGRTARAIAAESCGDEGREAWLDPALSTCKELRQDGEAELILRDFLAG